MFTKGALRGRWRRCVSRRGFGGVGGGDTAVDGEAGGNISGNPYNGGGGGGGAGCIITRTEVAAVPTMATCSPAVTSAAFRALSLLGTD